MLNKIRARSLREALGGEWEQDILRHSTASYRYQQCHNLETVAKELGNSPDTLRDHYLRPVTDKATVDFYSILPEPAPRMLNGY